MVPLSTVLHTMVYHADAVRQPVPHSRKLYDRRQRALRCRVRETIPSFLLLHRPHWSGDKPAELDNAAGSKNRFYSEQSIVLPEPMAWRGSLDCDRRDLAEYAQHGRRHPDGRPQDRLRFSADPAESLHCNSEGC